MTDQEKVNAKIMVTTMQIKEKHPELLKFLEELPVTIPNKKNPHINAEILADYHQSLIDLLAGYLQKRE